MDNKWQSNYINADEKIDELQVEIDELKNKLTTFKQELDDKKDQSSKEVDKTIPAIMNFTRGLSIPRYDYKTFSKKWLSRVNPLESIKPILQENNITKIDYIFTTTNDEKYTIEIPMYLFNEMDMDKEYLHLRNVIVIDGNFVQWKFIYDNALKDIMLCFDGTKIGDKSVLSYFKKIEIRLTNY